MWFADHLSELHAHGAVSVCAVGDDMAGFATVDPRRQCLEQLAIRPARFGSAVAGRLMAEARRLSPARLTLTVNQDNARALAFYGREGFRITGAGTNVRSGLQTWNMVWTAPVTPAASPR